MVKNLTTSLLVFGLILAIGLATPVIAPAAQTAEGFGQSWLLLGQYMQSYQAGSNPGRSMYRDFLTDGVITEKNIIPTAGMTINTKYGAQAASQQLFNPGGPPLAVPTVFAYAPPFNTVDFNVIFGDYSNVMMYAFTYANNLTASPLSCYVGVASDDCIQVLVNGVSAGAHNQGRGYGGDNNVDNAWSVTLQPGVNLVAVKVFEGGGGFGFRMRFQTDAATGVQGTGNSVPITSVTLSTAPGGFAYPAPPIPAPQPPVMVHFADFVSTTVIEAENYSWNVPNSSQWTAPGNVMTTGGISHPRMWVRESVHGASDATWHPRTISATVWTNRRNTSAGPSGGDFIYVATMGDTDQGHYSSGDDNPANQGAGVGYLVNFSTPGRYAMIPRLLAMSETGGTGESNRVKWQFDMTPAFDACYPVQKWGRSINTWSWDTGPEIWTTGTTTVNGAYAIYVNQPGTYWLRVYHRKIEFCLDAIRIVPWPAGSDPFPYLFSAGNATSYPQTLNVPIIVVAEVTRSIPADNYVAGGAPVPVALTATCHSPGPPFACTETLPLAWIPGGVIASPGTVAVPGPAPNVIIWTSVAPLAPGQVVTLTYMAQPAPGCNTGRFLGNHSSMGMPAGIPVEGDQVLPQKEGAGDGWQNSGQGWQIATHLGMIDPATSYSARWFACDNHYELVGSGRDLYNNDDECMFLAKYVTGDCAIEGWFAFETPPRAVDPDSKAGLMIRDNASVGSPFMDAIIRRNGEHYNQYRDAQNGAAASQAFQRNPSRLSSMWMKMECKAGAAGSTITTNIDTGEGNTGMAGAAADRRWPWRRFMANMRSPYLIGLCVTAHRGDAGFGTTDKEKQTARAKFWNVVTTGPVVASWPTASVVRTLPTTYSLTVASPVRLTATARGAGGAMVTTETLPANCTASGLVASQGGALVVGSNIVWTVPALAGVATLDYNVTPVTGYLRTAINFSGVYDNGDPITGALSIPVWGYDMPTEKPLGDVGQPLAASGLPLGSGDIGVVAYNGVSEFFAVDGCFIVVASGADVWGNADGFQYLYAPIIGDFSLAANTQFFTNNASDWAKIGLMLRGNLSPGSPHMSIMLRGQSGANTPAGQHNVVVQSRTIQDQGSDDFGGINAINVGPALLSISRIGTSVTVGYDTLPETTASVNLQYAQRFMVNIPSACYLGFAVTSHDQNSVVAGRFWNVVPAALPYTPPMGPGTRSFGAVTRATMGIPLTVTITVPHTAGSGAVTIEERYPSYCLVSNIDSTGVVTGAGTIQWVIAPWAASGNTVVSYQLTPQWGGSFGPLLFIGAYSVDTLGGRMPIGDTGLLQQGSLAFLQQGVNGYTGCQDDHITINAPNNNMGGSDYLEEGHWSNAWNDHKKILIQFKNIPAVSVPSIDVAQLWLYYDWTRSGTQVDHVIRTQKILKPWYQGTAMAGIDGRGALNGEVTWNSQVHSINPAWQINGLMGAADAGPFNNPGTTFGAQLPSWVIMDVTQDVKDFIAAPATNQGWKISQDKAIGVPWNDVSNPYTTGEGAYDLRSSENTDVGHRPMLLILDNTRYVPVVGTISRTLPATYAWGTTFTVTLNVNVVSGASTVTVVENLPTSPVAVANINNGGQRIGTQVIWVFAPFTGPKSCTYDLCLPWGWLYHQTAGTFPPLFFEGGYMRDFGGMQYGVLNQELLHVGTWVFQDGVNPTAGYAGTADAHIMMWTPAENNNAGATDRNEEGDWGGGLGDHKKAMMRFDLSSIPSTSGSLVVQARLWVRMIEERQGGGPGSSNHNAHYLRAWKVLKQWNEGTGASFADGTAALPGEVTYMYSSYTTTLWEIPGCQGLTDVGTSEPAAFWDAQWPQWVKLDVTNTVKDMIATPAANFGWKVSQDVLRGVPSGTAGNEYVQGAYDFIARHNTNYLPIYRPLLVIRPSTAVPVEISRFMLY